MNRSYESSDSPYNYEELYQQFKEKFDARQQARVAEDNKREEYRLRKHLAISFLTAIAF